MLAAVLVATPLPTAPLSVSTLTGEPTDRLLCRQFGKCARANFASRPSPNHHLAIFFPMAEERPTLTWVDSKEDEYEDRNYFHPVLDHLLHIPGETGYIGRGLRQVRGNIFRGRNNNQDTLHICTPPTLIGDTWGDFIWKGLLVAVMRAGSDFDPRHPTDITLTAYRDAIDYLGYYIDTVGSMIDEPGRHHHLSKVVLADKASKAIGVRINCGRDQAIRGEPEIVQVAMPKIHPLFNLESDDLCDIPSLFGLELVAKAYDSNHRDRDIHPSLDDLANPLAQLLLIRTSTRNGKWAYLPSYWSRQPLGSILFVDRSRRDIDITAICNLIKEVAVPFIFKGEAPEPRAEQKLLERLEQEGSKRGIGH
ncbi:hypothetical protein B0J15DRAFT_596622 [Fusarium solani]|uniref:Uncharacterized protein n=1 Tax=Fusarium solani TaxID=169388 RepID=A0A9P9H1G4_FUSSL|nr:uncharacterized protein B0J15DRAFT_596598 [Fusarium solani]XP_046128920.1 uncharacterized protein B0J15DRAFT_596622 [Fusarium solani]KAH7248425.1 hypothetical protein B0J15DRAFT_596598 [Fusarium solani]KAH7248484.1 hypothetical protein B0J15DRAFT_596622 [Fusarium solani]